MFLLFMVVMLIGLEDTMRKTPSGEKQPSLNSLQGMSDGKILWPHRVRKSSADNGRKEFTWLVDFEL